MGRFLLSVGELQDIGVGLWYNDRAVIMARAKQRAAAPPQWAGVGDCYQVLLERDYMLVC
jgi:hypothetical protein